MHYSSIFFILTLFILNTTTFGKSVKKGLCIPPGEDFHCGDLHAFSNVSWWYNWHVTPNHEMTPPENYCTCASGTCGTTPGQKIFVPMVWGYNEEDRPWHDDINDIVDVKYDIILGFNEPNHSDQSDIPPEEAAAAWMELQTLYPDKILVSPAPAGGNTNWFDPFFEECKLLGCRIDYLATHDYEGNVNHVMNRLEMLYNRYGKKIWLTEFAKCCTHNLDEIVDFAKEIIPRLEEADFVYRYSWFITRYNENNYQDGEWYLDPKNALFEKNSNQLSEVGKLYNSL